MEEYIFYQQQMHFWKKSGESVKYIELRHSQLWDLLFTQHLKFLGESSRLHTNPTTTLAKRISSILHQQMILDYNRNLMPHPSHKIVRDFRI
jgi:uncharacterized membrane protein YgaE (UPF0421/DUF939 family)